MYKLVYSILGVILVCLVVTVVTLHHSVKIDSRALSVEIQGILDDVYAVGVSQGQLETLDFAANEMKHEYMRQGCR